MGYRYVDITECSNLKTAVSLEQVWKIHPNDLEVIFDRGLNSFALYYIYQAIPCFCLFIQNYEYLFRARKVQSKKDFSEWKYYEQHNTTVYSIGLAPQGLGITVYVDHILNDNWNLLFVDKTISRRVPK